MRLDQLLSTATVIFLHSLLLGCGDDGGGTSNKVCTPGTTQVCVCPGGKQGAQTCASDGLSWGTCDCGGDTPDAGIPDAPVPDVANPDGQPPDSHDVPDTPLADAVTPDGPVADAALPDATLPDLPLSDLTPPDAGPVVGKWGTMIWNVHVWGP
jgi:hypothetical protein